MKNIVYNLLTSGHELLGVLLFLMYYIVIILIMLGASYVIFRIWEKISNFLFGEE